MMPDTCKEIKIAGSLNLYELGYESHLRTPCELIGEFAGYGRWPKPTCEPGTRYQQLPLQSVMNYTRS